MLKELTKPFFILAPMDDVTDTIFRQIVSSCYAPDICFSEFVNVDGLMSPGRPKLLRKLDWRPGESPLVAHIWGLVPANFKAVADQLASGSLAAELGLEQNYAGIDLNMGCPAKQVVKAGACSALIQNQQLAKEIIEATKKGAANRLPISVKTRLGYNQIDLDWIGFLLEQQLSMLSIHLRTTKEMSRVPAQYDQLTNIIRLRDAIAPETLIVANGDILNKAQGLELVTKYRLDGIMVGRGIFSDPYAFSDPSPWPKLAPAARLDLFNRHLSLFVAWAERPNMAVGRLNKYAKIYINGFDGAKDLRERLAKSKTIDEMQQVLLTKADS